MDNTIKAYSRDINGFTRGEPTGRYFAPANYDNCIETINTAYGDCGVRTFVLTPQWFRAFDLSFVKEVKLQGRQNMQFRIDMLNALGPGELRSRIGRRQHDRGRLAGHRRQLGPGDSAGHAVQLVGNALS